MTEHQPARLSFHRRAAIAHLDHFPRIFRHEQQFALTPIIQLVGSDQEDVLAILAAYQSEAEKRTVALTRDA